MIRVRELEDEYIVTVPKETMNELRVSPRIINSIKSLSVKQFGEYLVGYYAAACYDKTPEHLFEVSWEEDIFPLIRDELGCEWAEYLEQEIRRRYEEVKA